MKYFLSKFIYIFLKILVIIWVMSYCTKKVAFEDDHVFQDEELPIVYYCPEDPTIGIYINYLLLYIC